MDADTDTSRESLTPEDETWAYLEQLERRAQMRKIRRTAIPDDAQREGEDFS